MKPIQMVFIFVIFMQLTFTLKAYSQEESVKDSVIKRPVTDSLISTPKLGPDFNLRRNFDMPDIPEIDRRFLPGNEGINRGLPAMREFEDHMSERQFPGSSRFYARRPYLYSNPGSGDFIRKPDSSVKYYLIIMDPLRHTVTK